MGCIEITDAGPLSLAALQSLTSLNLHECDQITENGLASLAALTSLTSLNLRGCNQITEDGLASLAALTSLKVLTLPEGKILPKNKIEEFLKHPAQKRPGSLLLFLPVSPEERDHKRPKPNDDNQTDLKTGGLTADP